MSRFRKISPTLLAGGTLALAALAAYHNSFSGPFTFDDIGSIAENPTIRHLWPIWDVLRPPAGGITVSGRPVLNLSLALNYALGGTNVWSYHAFNLLIHILAGLTLFGVVRRTLNHTTLAFAVALLWTVHPLQTESVTYVVQRAESLMGLFYLLTLYFFIRYAGQNFEIRSSKFAICSAAACLLGMATKEVMVSAPVMVWLYDRTFISGTFRDAWRRHRGLYVGLACTWIPLGFLVVSTHARGGTSGFATGIPWWKYTLTQFPAVVNYLRLAVIPAPLIFDYGSEWLPSPWTAVPYAVMVVMLIAGVGWAMFGKVRNSKFGIRNLRALGFAGAFFFAILAPTLVVPEIRQTMADHRMYLALAPVIAVVVGIFRNSEFEIRILMAVAIVFGCLTARRNEAYRTDLSLWRDTVAKRPGNAFAQSNLGVALLNDGRTAEATARFEKALQLDPLDAQAEHNLGLAMVAAGRPAEAMSCYERAIGIKPDLYKTRNNLGVLLTNAGRLPEAIGQLEEALRIKPDFAEGHIDLGIALAAAGRTTEAIDQYAEALRLKPDSPEARSNRGNALRQAGQLSGAVADYELALRLKPDYAEAHNNLGVAFAEMGRSEDAIGQYEQALKFKPDFADAHKNLGTALARINQLADAAGHFDAAVRIVPGDASARNALGGVLFQLGRISEAIPQYEEALRLKPDYPEACANLGIALANAGRLPEAVRQLTRAVELKPDYAEAHSNLAVVLAASGRLTEAILHYEEALRLQPNNADIRYNYAAALQQAGRTEEAKEQLAEAERNSHRGGAENAEK